ncbi:MAG: DNA mismatch repair protein MutS [Oscillatoriales cyanobacterium SM2_2_1]|nr:DNA mismatch repair protein MutS [Oscillatoriales cyanobacterium SM2_2_1]
MTVTPLALTSLTDQQRAALTPMMQHYAAIKDAHPQAIVLYRLGDFYEAFLADAALISRELELVLTGRDGGKDVGRIAMAGIPHHALERYARQLVAKGYAIAICEQMEDPAAAQGLVRREVTRIITPGTVLEEGLLSAKHNNFLAAIALGEQQWGLAYADVSTGECWTTQWHSLGDLTPELHRLQPAEVLVAEVIDPGDLFAVADQLPLPEGFRYTQRSPQNFALQAARDRILETFGVRSLEPFGCQSLPYAIRAVGAILCYLQETQKQMPVAIARLVTYSLSEYVQIDPQTRRNLELTQTVRDGQFSGSLLWALDRTTTGMGSRLLRRWLLQPLRDCAAIEQRYDTIAEISQQHHLRQQLRRHLHDIYDLERLCGRVRTQTANARDLLAIALSIQHLQDLTHVVAPAHSPYLVALQTLPPAILHLAQELQRTLTDDPPIALTEGNLIRVGACPELEALRQQVNDDKNWIIHLEKTERERTGIGTLKVGFNKAFGYFISISRGKSDQAPTDYIRKQTLTNEERYITPQLKERELRILTAESSLHQLEYEIFLTLRSRVYDHLSPLTTLAQHLAAADALCGLAEVATQYTYCRPQLIDGDRILNIHQGRHPVVEQTLPAGFFVPNSVSLGQGTDLIILTGPNMSGKSIYLRQIGLIQLMAQIGSFVPATAARLGIADRIFTRVGAVDDLATGQSTFMVEMNETANILNHACPQSLVLLDEIGRGTSTFDGMAIAWSVAEHLAQHVGARSIFATHYHELNELANLLANVANFQVTVKELTNEIVFLHQVQPGGADRSYGIEVGRIAGLPPTVIQRAQELLDHIAAHSYIAIGLHPSDLSPPVP